MTHSGIRNGLRLTLVAAAMALWAAPATVLAQSELDVAEAEDFLGSWTVALETDMGPMEMGLDIRDEDGKVAAALEAPQQGSQSVTDITRSEQNLVLRYAMDAQGQSIPVSITLQPQEDDGLRTILDFMGGQFTATGTATRSDGS